MASSAATVMAIPARLVSGRSRRAKDARAVPTTTRARAKSSSEAVRGRFAFRNGHPWNPLQEHHSGGDKLDKAIGAKGQHDRAAGRDRRIRGHAELDEHPGKRDALKPEDPSARPRLRSTGGGRFRGLNTDPYEF